MPYDNAYNRMVADDVMALNKKYIAYEKEKNGGGLSGGFMGALAGMILPQIMGEVAHRVIGNGMKGGNGCDNDAHSLIPVSAQYKCGDADRSPYDASSHNGPTVIEGGSGFARGTFRDTGYERVLGAGKGVGHYKKRGASPSSRSRSPSPKAPRRKRRPAMPKHMKGKGIWDALKGIWRMITGQGDEAAPATTPSAPSQPSKSAPPPSRSAPPPSRPAPPKEESAAAQLAKEGITDKKSFRKWSVKNHPDKAAGAAGSPAFEAASTKFKHFNDLAGQLGYSGGRKRKMAGGCGDCEGGAKGMDLVSNVAGMFGLGKSGGGLTGTDKAYLKRLRTRLEAGKKMTKRDEKKLMELKEKGHMEGGFLPALLGSIAMPLVSSLIGKIFGGSSATTPKQVISMSGGASLGLPPSIAGGKRRGRKSKMAGGALVPVANMKASYMAGFGKPLQRGPKGKRSDIVKRVMAERGLKMIEASKYVKEHNLY
jgi:hypothetical protein